MSVISERIKELNIDMRTAITKEYSQSCNERLEELCSLAKQIDELLDDNFRDNSISERTKIKLKKELTEGVQT